MSGRDLTASERVVLGKHILYLSLLPPGRSWAAALTTGDGREGGRLCWVTGTGWRSEFSMAEVPWSEDPPFIDRLFQPIVEA